MEKRIHLHVLTGEGPAIEDEATSIIAPAELGALGILYNHAPLVTTLQPGPLKWRTLSGEWKVANIGSGLLEIAHNQLTILTNTVTILQTHETSPLAHA